jgi:MFS family permease
MVVSTSLLPHNSHVPNKNHLHLYYFQFFYFTYSNSTIRTNVLGSNVVISYNYITKFGGGAQIVPRSFYYLLTGQSGATLANYFIIVAITSVIYHGTESAANAALVPLLSGLAGMLSGIIAPAIVDRFTHHRLLTILQIFKTIILFPFAVVFLKLSGMHEVLLVFVVIFSLIGGFSNPLKHALVPRLVEKKDLTKANSLLSTVLQTLMLLGWVIGGAFLAFLGAIFVVWLALGLAIAATILFSLIEPGSQQKDIGVEHTSLWKKLSEGWEELWRVPTLRIITGMNIIEAIANGVWTGALLLVYAEEFLHKDETWWGFINASYYAGTMLGGYITIRYARKLNPILGKSMVVGASMMALFTALFATIPVGSLALILCVLMGPAYYIRDVCQNTIFQLDIAPQKMAKVYAASNTIMSLLFSVSVLIMGIVADLTSVSGAFGLAAILYGVSASIGGVYAPLRRKQFAEESVEASN